MSNKHLVSGIIIGAAAGAAIGLLFATDKGAELRKKIGDQLGKLTDNFGGVVGDSLKNVAKEKTGSAKEA